MSKIKCVVASPVDTFSGYGTMARNFSKALLKLKRDEWDIELLTIVIDYKNNSIDLEETVNRFRNVLSDSKYYEIR